MPIWVGCTFSAGCQDGRKQVLVVANTCVGAGGLWAREKAPTQPPTQFSYLSVIPMIRSLREDWKGHVRACQ